MKRITYISSLLLVFTLLLLFPMKSFGQCGNISVSVKTTNSPCSDNGRIEVIVTGKDITDDKYTGLQYRIFRPGSSDSPLWIDNNVRSNLPAGTYQIDIRGLCEDAGGGYVEKENAVPPVTLVESTWQPLNMKAEVQTQHTLECLADGKVAFKGVSGGTGPYTLKITSTPPAGYTGITSKTFNTISEINNFVWEGLPSGSYTFELSESSMCNSTATASVTINEISLSSFPSLFSYLYNYRAMFPSKDDSECTNALTAGWYYINSTTQATFYYYLSRASQYFEYAVIYPEDGAASSIPNSSLTWNALPNYNSYVPLTDLRYNVDDINSDITNRRPKIYVRVKGCPDIKREFTPPMYNTTPSIGRYSNGCVNRFYGGSIYSNSAICFPATWKLYKKESDGTYTLVESSPAPIASKDWISTNYFTNQPTSGVYRWVVTGACGKDYIASDYTVTLTNPASLTGTSSALDCDAYEVPCLYFGSSAGGLNNISSVKLLSVAKKVDGGSYTTITSSDPDYMEPDFTEWKQEDVSPSLLTSNPNYLCMWANDIDKTVIRNFSTSYNSTFHANGNMVPLERRRIVYRFTYEVTDICGNVNSNVLQYVGNNAYYENVVEPQTQTDFDCVDSWYLRIPNVTNLLKLHYRYNAPSYVSNTTPYIRIVDGPAGGYPSGFYDYIRSSTDVLKLTKPGTYTIKAFWNSNTGNIYADCLPSYTFTIGGGDTTFDLDGNMTAAFRCQSSAIGDGYIKIAVKNGSGGPYSYELFQKDTLTGVFHSITTNTTGEFQGWLEKRSDEYKVKVADNGCSTTRTFEKGIAVYDLTTTAIAWIDNNNVCPGDNIVLHALALGSTTYKWTGPNGWTSTDKDPVISNAGPEHSGVYTVEVDVPLCGGQTMTYSINVSVGIPTLYWSPGALDGDWFNPTNWLHADGSTSSGYPSPCTTVHISGNADHYPNLDKTIYPWDNNGRPVCDTIIYHYGSSTASPTHLIYKGAKIQYNWGYYDSNPVSESQPGRNQDETYPGNNSRPIPRLPRGNWNMLSAPLKYMTSGDFNLAGHPNTFQRLYNYNDVPNNIITQTNGHTRPFAKYNIDLRTVCSALAVAVAPYKTDHTGAKDQTNLQTMEGIIEIPYLFNPTHSALHPFHSYNEATKESTFTYYNVETLAPIPASTDKITRDAQSYRFVYEQTNNEPEKIIEGSEEMSIYRMALITPQTGNKIMIGNPLMSHIDFDKLYSQNSTKIQDSYEIVEATTGNTLTYKIGALGNTAPSTIAPLQAFIVERKNPAANDSLYIYLDGSKTVITHGPADAALPKPKTTTIKTTPESWVHIKTQVKDTTTGWINTDASRLLIGTDVKNNTPKMTKAEDLEKQATTFLIAKDGTWNEDLNIPSQQQTTTYPIGILTTITGEITLHILPGGKLAKVELEDKHLNQKIDVTNGGKYTFYHRTDWFTGRQGMDISRFRLIVTPK